MAVTLAVAALLLLLLEFRWPYYFLQADGLDYFLPYYVHNWRSLLAGKLPFYNFHVYAGIPHAALGQTGVFYIPQYLAMFLSQSILGHPFATIDLMAFMHALIAVAGGYTLLLYLGAADTVAAFGGLTAFTGFFVWAGRDWPHVPMVCAWFPWMVWASLRYLEKPSASRAGWPMFFRLGLLFAGYPQFFVLAMIFEHLFTLAHSATTHRPDWKRRWLGYLALDVPTALLGLPFLLAVWAEVGGSFSRSAPLTYQKFSAAGIPPILWLFGQLFAFIQLHVPTAIAFPAYASYIGYLPALLPLGVGVLWKRRPVARSWLIACGVCFVIALLWCWGVLGPVIYHLPVLNRFTIPFKLVFFAGFFQCLAAALVLTLFSRRWQRVAIAVFLVNWIVVFCLLPNHAWDSRKLRVPLRSPWQEALKDGRYLVINRGPISSVSREYVDGDCAEFWGLDNLLGYETLVPRLNATLLLGRPARGEYGNYTGFVDQGLISHLKLWSVKYLLVSPRRALVSEILSGAGFQAQTVKRGWTLWKDPQALPRVRWGDVNGAAEPGAGIRWVEHVNSIDVYLSQWPGRQLVFAFAANPGLETCLGGHCSSVGDSADGLIRVNVPPGTRHVRLVYHDALFLPSVLIVLATLAVYLLLLFRGWRQSSRHVLGIGNVAEAVGHTREN